MLKPFVNWDEIANLAMGSRRPSPPRQEGNEGQGGTYGAWDNQAGMYDQVAKMEAVFTLNQINCFDTSPEDSVLDCGCGPGRITVPMAKRAKSVTALDSSPKMLEICAANAKEAGLTNVTTKLLDFDDIKLGENLERHDIVICSRSAGLNDLVRLSALAKKYVVTVIWAHGYPNIPTTIGKLFEGMEESRSPGAPQSMPVTDRRLGNNLVYNRVYDMGFDPNLRIVDDGFTKTFASREEAYDDLLRLRAIYRSAQKPAEDQMRIFRSNVDKYLTVNPDGTVTYLSTTKSIVMWWDPQREE